MPEARCAGVAYSQGPYSKISRVRHNGIPYYRGQVLSKGFVFAAAFKEIDATLMYPRIVGSFNPVHSDNRKFCHVLPDWSTWIFQPLAHKVIYQT